MFGKRAIRAIRSSTGLMPTTREKQMEHLENIEKKIWDEIARLKAYQQYFDEQLLKATDQERRKLCATEKLKAKLALGAYQNVLNMIEGEKQKCQKEDITQSDAKETS